MDFMLGLPNETLLQIVGDLALEDLPSFALSCKHMLALSQRGLVAYVQRRKRHETVEFHACARDDNESNLPALLQGMFDDHRMACYPTSMIIEITGCSYGCCGTGDYGAGLWDGDDGEYSGVQGIEKLKSIIQGFEMANTKKQREYDDQRVRVRTRRQLYPIRQWKMMLCLLLSALPNIKILTLRMDRVMMFSFQQILYSAVGRGRDLGHTGPTVLTKLKSIVVDSIDTTYYGGTNSYSSSYKHDKIFGCFGLLPSVEHLSGKLITSRKLPRSGWNENRYDWPRREGLAVTDINFEDSKLSLDFFSQLLRGVTRLRTFTYGFIGGSGGTDPFRLIDLLLLRSKKTLEQLKLEGFASQQISPPHGAGHGSLRDFEALKDVYVHSNLCISSKINHKTTFLREGFHQTEEVTVIPLVEILPSCIETIQLEGPTSLRDVNDLLSGLAGSKGRRLRSLKTIVFRDVERPTHSFEVNVKKCIENCAELGIKLKLKWAQR